MGWKWTRNLILKDWTVEVGPRPRNRRWAECPPFLELHPWRVRKKDLAEQHAFCLWTINYLSDTEKRKEQIGKIRKKGLLMLWASKRNPIIIFPGDNPMASTSCNSFTRSRMMFGHFMVFCAFFCISSFGRSGYVWWLHKSTKERRLFHWNGKSNASFSSLLSLDETPSVNCFCSFVYLVLTKLLI